MVIAPSAACKPVVRCYDAYNFSTTVTANPAVGSRWDEWGLSMHRVALSTALALVCVIAAQGVAPSQDYPSRAIKLVLPQPAGGAVDLIARSLGERLAEQLSQPVIVENMPGANGSLAGAAVSRAAPDGYTLMVAVDTNLVVNPNLYPNLTYDPFRDFTPISVLSRLYLVLVGSNKLEAKNVGELITYAKAHPGKLNYASIGLGTQAHLGMELFKLMTKTEITQVPYRGTNPAMTAIVASEADVMFTGPPSAKAMSDNGQLKILAVGAPKRTKAMPDVPTVAESGVPGYVLEGWFGILGPAKLPKPILDRLSAEVRRAVADPRFSERLNALGIEVVGSTPREMLTLMQSDTKTWADVIQATGAKVQQ
jgi:tripartite-type tricarboxylate transporter receptor subunit TctC